MEAAGEHSHVVGPREEVVVGVHEPVAVPALSAEHGQRQEQVGHCTTDGRGDRDGYPSVASEPSYGHPSADAQTPGSDGSKINKGEGPSKGTNTRFCNIFISEPIRGGHQLSKNRDRNTKNSKNFGMYFYNWPGGGL